jgi:hypothetical protein
LRLLETKLRRLTHRQVEPTTEHLETMRARTGYDILIPEAMLGEKVEMFITATYPYRHLVERIYVQDAQPISMGPQASFSGSGH